MAKTYWLEQINKNLDRIADALEKANNLKELELMAKTTSVPPPPTKPEPPKGVDPYKGDDPYKWSEPFKWNNPLDWWYKQPIAEYNTNDKIVKVE